MELQLWHGGRDLEYSYRELRGSKNGKWEHGAGLYLTTHYDTALSYSKGGGKTYLISLDIDPDKDLYSKKIKMEEALNFISKNCKKNKLSLLSTDLHENLKRSGNMEHISLDVLQNLIINHEAIVHSKSYLLNQFIIDCGVQYGIVPRFKGRDEQVLVIYDRSVIKKVKAIPSKEVTSNMFELEFPQFNFKKILNEQEIKENTQVSYSKLKP